MSEDELDKEWQEQNLSGLTGDRRRNPFPAFSQTEYELFLATIRQQARVGAEQALEKHIDNLCRKHCKDTESIKTVVFGSRERNVEGLDAKVDDHERILKKLTADIEWSKRLIYTTIATGTVSIIVTFALR